MSGAAALARARQRREEAVAEQQRLVTAEAAEILAANERARANGLVEKTAGESGQVGVLHRKWLKWLESEHGKGVAGRLAAEGGGPTVDDAKLFATWVHQTRQN